MDDADLYFVDARNDAREQRAAHFRPTRAMAVSPASRVYTIPTQAAPSMAPPQYGPPNGYAPPGYAPPGYVPPGYYTQPPMWGQNWGQSTLGSLFGGINVGQLIELVGQGFAAIKSLPPSPPPTGDVASDVTNLLLYQESLAEHGKLDEQIRTGVHIIAKLLGG